MLATPLLFLVGSSLGLAQAPSASLSFGEGAFTLRSGQRTVRVPIAGPKEASSETKEQTSVDRIVFRKDDAFAVWDSRGLTVRKGERVFTTLMPEIAVSPKALSEEEILRARMLFAMQLRFPGASALSGARRIGNMAYFLLRWDDWTRTPWLEALVEVDLSSQSPKPRYLGRFEGFSFPVAENRLLVLNGRPAAVTVSEGSKWGRAEFKPADAKANWIELGEGLDRLELHSRGFGAFWERSRYGTRLFGRVDLAAGTRRPLMESRGNVRLLDSESPWIAIAHEEYGVWLRNLESGAKLRLPQPCGIRRTALGVVVWSPPDRPTECWAYEIERLEALAHWTKPGGPPAPANAGRAE